MISLIEYTLYVEYVSVYTQIRENTERLLNNHIALLLY